MENRQNMYNIIDRGFSDWEYERYIEKDPNIFAQYVNGADGNTLINESRNAEIAEMVHRNMNGMLDFMFEGNEIHIIMQGNTPDCTLFYGPDVASVLEYSEPYNMYQMLLPNEHPKAIMFQNWVYHVVLPSMWNYGYYASIYTRGYINNNPTLALDYNKKIDELEQQIGVMAPKARFGNFVLDNIQPINIEELAKLLNTSGIDIGRNRLFELLRKDGYLMKNSNVNKPTQKALDSGLLMYNIIPLYNGNVCTYVYVTPKGIEHFINKYKDLNKK